MILLFGNQVEILIRAYLLGIYSLFAGFPFIYLITNTINLEESWLNRKVRVITCFLFSLPFLIKLPCYFFHLWLPIAHVEAPTVGSIILASLILKLGRVGLLHMISFLSTSLIVVSVIGAVCCSLICCLYRDTKVIVAYRRINHISFFSISLWLLTQQSTFSS